MNKNFKKIEAVTVCVGYSDFLAHIIANNKPLFDKWVIVTDTKDVATKNLCDFYNVMCVQTDVFYENGDVFNKGKGINEGLKRLDLDGWVIHFDSDIFLPSLTRQILNNLDLDERGIYGIDRMMCPNYETWINYIENPELTHSGWCYVHPNIFPMGERLAEYKGNGYNPIGFFQMWNPKKSDVYWYPENHGAADRTDVLHAKQFNRRNSQLLPEIICIHLDSEGLSLNQMGKNWYGRKTALFSLGDTLKSKHINISYHLKMIWRCIFGKPITIQLKKS